MFAWLRCLWRKRHDPVRHPLGGFRCRSCGTAGADLDEMGFVGAGYVKKRARESLAPTAPWARGVERDR